MLRRALIACALALLALHAGAASIVPPQDLGELARTSEAVVLAQAGAPRVSQHGPLLFTLTTFRVLEVAAGPAQRGDRVTVETPGGELDGFAWLVAGTPHFEPGQVYLLFLSQKATGEWLPQVMSYGVLRRVAGRDGTTLLEPLDDAYSLDVFPRPDGIVPEAVQTYREAALLQHLGAVAGGGAGWDAGQVLARADQLPLTASALGAPTGCTYLNTGSYPPRWPYNTASSPGQVTIYAESSGDSSYPGGASGAITAVQNAVGAPDGWMGIPNTSLNFTSGSRSYPLQCSGNCATTDHPPLYVPCAGDNVVVFNDPCGQITDLSGCTGTLAFGGPYTGGTHVLPSDGSTWTTIWSLFVVVNNGAGCLGATGYREMLTHEIGHGLGYDHPPGSYQSVMHASCCWPVSSFDQGCTQYTYPSALPTATPTATPTPGPPTPTPTATPTLAPPQPPTGVSASKGAYTDRVRVTWISSTGATSYGVWRYISNNSLFAQLLGQPTLTVYDDTTATPGATYWYWVTAHNNAGDSAFSSPDTGYAAVPTPTPTLTPTVTPTRTRTPTATPTATRTNTPAIFYASFTFTPPAPAVGGAVQFTDASNGATSWQWTFGDGGTSTAKSPSHTFGQVGAFTVTLQAGNGVTNATASKPVTVYDYARRHLSR